MIITGLSDCTNCGCKMHMGYACGEHFVFPSGIGCDWCRGYTEMHSTLEQTLDAWNKACERGCYIKKDVPMEVLNDESDD
jgi:hypothetical protein